jgi:hypothetical protein
MRLRIRVEQLVVETFSVVLGILLALGANAWHDSIVHGAQARDALSNIRGEIAANRAAIAEKVQYHAAMRDSLDAVVARTRTASPPGGLLAIHGWNGICPLRLVDNAWQTAGATGAMQYMPFAVVLPLSRAYGLQQRVVDIQRAFYSVVYTPEFAVGGVAAFASMSSFLSDLVANERQLVAQYDLALASVSAKQR